MGKKKTTQERQKKIVSADAMGGNARSVQTDTTDNRVPQSAKGHFPVVGIGASAGGLEALQQLLDGLPAQHGVAFVVVMHQQAGRVSLLPELLARHTDTPILEAADGMPLEPQRIYLAPSTGQLNLLDGRFYVIPAGPGLNLPIDCFFRSLSIERKKQAVGIVLSGTGSDGTLGIKAIKGAAGMVMVQDPASAKFDGMPNSAIATGAVDFVLTPEKMPPALFEYFNAPYTAKPVLTEIPSELAEVLPKIFVLLRNRTRHDFSHYKTNTLRRRIERRMTVHQIDDPESYVRYLQANVHEQDLLFRELLIGVTSFFRDPEAFELLATEVLPALLKSKPNGYTVRIWSAGCSTGEEAYSLAMVAREVIDRVNPKLQLQVFATDLNDRAIDIARRGKYAEGISADISEGRLQRFFTKEDRHYEVRKDLRENLIFAPQDIILDPPFSKLDLLACRNVLIYMDAELQKRMLPVFHYAINPGGILFLGNSESVGQATDAFRTIDRKWKIVARRPEAFPARLRLRGNYSSGYSGPSKHSTEKTTVTREKSRPPQDPSESELRRFLDRRLLQSYVPPTVIASDRGEIVYIHCRTGAFLEPAPGEPSNSILTMARSGLQPTLSVLMRRVAAEGGEAVQRGVRIADNGNSVLVDIVVRKIEEPEIIRGLLIISFEHLRDPSVDDAPAKSAPKKSRGRVAELEQEILYVRESLQSSIEHSESTNEELKSSNEEIQSTNEELQSTNEELETSKEELQSLNEELQTVNVELQMKMEDLAVANDDMANLLNNTRIATIFLDNELQISRFTKAAADVIKIIPTDVGRPISDLTTNLNFNLEKDGRQVLESLMTTETEAQSKDGRWYQVRLMPYRTRDNVIKGLVATFVDITTSKIAEIKVAAAGAFAQCIVDTVRQPLLVLDDKFRVVSASEAFYRTFDLTPATTTGLLIYELSDGQWNVAAFKELLEQVLPKDTAIDDFQIELNVPKAGKQMMLLNARQLKQAADLPGRILLVLNSIDDCDP